MAKAKKGTTDDALKSPMVSGLDPKMVKVEVNEKAPIDALAKDVAERTGLELVDLTQLVTRRAEVNQLSGLRVGFPEGIFQIGESLYTGTETAVLVYDGKYYAIPKIIATLLLRVYDN